MKHAVAIVLKGYPRLSETFIAQEILSLQRLGLDYHLISLRHPTDGATHPIHQEITGPVSYLPEYLYQAPGRVFRAWRAVRRAPGYQQAWINWVQDLRRDFTANRVRRFGQALVLAHELPPEINWIYAHFLHTPASVARYAANIKQLPWSCSAHAKDIWTSPDWEKTEKLMDMAWLVTCTRANRDHLQGLNNDTGDKVQLLYHGLDFERFNSDGHTYSKTDGSAAQQPVKILSVGRAVEKKGYDVLLRALDGLAGDLNWKMIHVGGGELLSNLKNQALKSGLSDRIEWRGACPQEMVLELYREADIFVLASRVADDGDRDGLPNVLMEAQSQGLPCLSTRVSAIPELIIDNETGVLVEPDDENALSSALARLIREPALRQKLGQAGKKRVSEAFSHHATIGALAKRFGLNTNGAME